MTHKQRERIIIFILIAFIMGAVLGGGVGILLFIRVTGGTGAPSEPISAPTISISNYTIPEVTTEIIYQEISTKTPTVSSNPQSQIISGTTTQPTTIPANSPNLFRIMSEESEARFSVFETFPRGTAIGRTNEVAGDIIVDFNSPPNSQLGIVRINLRTLRTDEVDRDRSIRCCVLLTAQDEYEFTDFVPTEIISLPEQFEINEPIAFQVIGNLTLRGITRPVTFDVILTATSPNEIQGLATTVVNRSDFGILNDSRNDFTFYGVALDVTLEFEFVARRVTQ